LITEKGSPGFEEFINILGDKIELKGWQGFRAGLDTNSENSSFLSFSFLSFLSQLFFCQMETPELIQFTLSFKVMR